VAYAIAKSSLTVAGQWRIYTALPEHRASELLFLRIQRCDEQLLSRRMRAVGPMVLKRQRRCARDETGPYESVGIRVLKRAENNFDI
jgi:hypothetical protein